MLVGPCVHFSKMGQVEEETCKIWLKKVNPSVVWEILCFYATHVHIYGVHKYLSHLIVMACICFYQKAFPLVGSTKPDTDTGVIKMD